MSSEGSPPDAGGNSASGTPDVMGATVRETISEALRDPNERARLGIDTNDETRAPVVVELNVTHPGGLELPRARLMDLFTRVLPESDLPTAVSGSLYKGWLTIEEIRQLVGADAEEPDRRRRAIYRIWPDFPLRALGER